MLNFKNSKILYEDFERLYDLGVNYKVLNNKTIYITGSTGMIASYLILFLIYLNENRNIKINIIANCRNKDKAKAIFGNYIENDYFKLDIRDVINDIDIIDDCNYVIHSASLASPQFYGDKPVETMLPNIIGTYKLLEYFKNKKIESFLFFSSGAIYGKSNNDNKIITEETYGEFDFLKNGTIYGESKRCGEALCKMYYNEYGIPTKSIRITHTFGPTINYNNDSRSFSEFIKNIINNEDIVLKSDGKAKRAYSYLSDTVDGVFRVLLLGKNGESYNICNNNNLISIESLAFKLAKLYEKNNIKVIKKERYDLRYSKTITNDDVIIDTSKIEELGWKAKINIEECFERTIDFIQNK